MISERLKKLRVKLAEQQLDGFLVPLSDPHQSEYVHPQEDRLLYMTGFNGSAGQAIILNDKAAIFVDGRYTLQAEQQVDANLYEHCHLTQHPPYQWLNDHAGSTARIGFDPWLFTKSAIDQLKKKLNCTLVPVDHNPIDAIWEDRPIYEPRPFYHYDLAYAGQRSEDKIKALLNGSFDALILTQPISISWLLNIRGQDLEHVPIALCFAIVMSTGEVKLFTDAIPPSDMKTYPMAEFASEVLKLKGRVQLDPKADAFWLFDQLASRAEIFMASDPCILPKACKNPHEVAGIRQAHIWDGVAMARFLHWFATHDPQDEIHAAQKLDALRRENPNYRALSFQTISGFGPNGAVIHYRVSAETNLKIKGDGLYLIDSGGQYISGTTDITRVLPVGNVTSEMKRDYTLVLKGHIALARAKFPYGTKGSQLDALARQYLWQKGLDYDHGTGHGVGAFLSVHEGPQRIARVQDDACLEVGMVISNEPGYYKNGAYGIRLENLVVVQPAAEEGFLQFETLSFTPFSGELIEIELLDETEKKWLLDYHQKIIDIIGPELYKSDSEAYAWLCEQI